ncbi:hypothetical protein CANTEDRAFT_115492 [Yamadazyma tenuis ATCC 10573]|uniref:Altered inheritance of mitochondria protein 24, mitochondrial n=1 Tax=Candida tenuis (strain ATCC 10573 / BCRC 21748 / CBS 615 / JCM 9827 / NBRC 10315 / NRRL Y-1498 / VKM Y-70) TaxID=590646 RepID=G3BAD5_CANTC|nr:uncharacterized protein CANTEDRAFT_115492 [Yamadazyma tenuis ATCC 10573]EGV62753.1 hypothetical protein CANTEDRAFT_115492 [Yamadazyma tenuis ATCC 10573]
MNRLSVFYGSVRSISISTSSLPIISTRKTITTNENIQNSVLSVDLPASVPIYIRRGALISIYGISTLSTSSLTQSLSSWGYQRLMSTSKISLLLTSNANNWFKMSNATNNKSMSILNLDGTTDWALLSSPHFYIGDSLIMKNFILPYKISKRFSRELKLPTSTRTGLFGWYKWYFQLVSGRGQIGVVGKGSIYNINLVENEEVLVNKDNLLAITVNGPYDLQNCVIKYETPTSEQTQPVEPTSNTTFNDYFLRVLKFFGLFKAKSTNYLIGNQNFVKVIGPRNILIQSDINYKVPEFPTDDFDKSLKQFNKKASDYLNWVKVGSQNSSIKSTKDFQS